MNLPRSLSVFLFTALVGWSALAYRRLPESIPQHFDIRGHADAWTRTSLLSWFAPILLALATVALVQGIAALLPRYPHLINMPDKDKLLALPPEKQRPVIEVIQSMVDWITLEILTVFALVQWSMYRAAHGGQQDFIIVFVVLMSPVGLIIAMIFLGKAQHRLREAQRTMQQEAT